MTDSQLRDRAKQLAREAGIENFKSSDGWLANFKKRHSIKLSNVSHEPQDPDQVGINRATSVLQKIIDELGFHPQDVFNFGETGLYFRAQPVKNVVTIPLRIRKLQKDRITIGFCLNATGEEKLKLVVVYKSKSPRCFGGWNPESLVHYHYNNHARMTNNVSKHLRSSLFIVCFILFAQTICFLSKTRRKKLIIQDKKKERNCCFVSVSSLFPLLNPIPFDFISSDPVALTISITIVYD